MKRLFALLLAIAMVLTLVACGDKTSSLTPVNPGQDSVNLSDEISKAIELGITDDNTAKKLTDQITYKDFCSMIDSLVELLTPEQINAWQSRSALFHDSEELMNRMEGAVVFLYAAECMNLDTVGIEHNIPLEDLVAPGTDFWAGATVNSSLLPNVHDLYFAEELLDTDYRWRCEETYWNSAVRFVEYYSYGNGKTYFDYDKAYLLNLGEPFTYEAAVCALVRLYETGLFAQYVPVTEVSYTVPEELLSNAAKLPEASEKSLPNWHGCTVAMRSWAGVNYAGMYYEKEEIEVLSEQGFDFVRVPLQSWQFFKGEDFSQVNPQALLNLNQLIEWCAEYGIHICIDLHDMPGFYTAGDDTASDLFENKNRQQLFVDFWSFFATYYENVPTNLLSFNLLNEPHTGGELDSAVYAEVMRPAIDAIRAVNSNRIIFIDMIDFINGTPVYELVDTGVAQAWHPYFLDATATAWPTYFINGFIHRENGTLTLNGNFPADTSLQFLITSFHSTGELAVLADGVQISALTLGGEAIGENGCINIGEEGTGGEYRDYEGVMIEIKLPTAASQIKLELRDSWWYRISSISIDTADRTYTLSENESFVENDVVPILEFQDDGAIVAQNESSLYPANAESLLEKYQAIAQFREETGIQVMAQEFGFKYTVPQAATLAATEDFLAAMEQLELPWCCWCGDFAPLMDGREIDYSLSVNLEKIDLRREGSEYVPVSENWVANRELLEIYRRYITD